MSRAEGTYAFLAATFAVVLVLTNIIGVKLFVLFPNGGPGWLNGGEPVTLTTGIITYPMTFLLTDLVAEIWGKRRANLMVVLGFFMSLLMLVTVKLAIVLPPSAAWAIPELGLEHDALQDAFEATFRFPGTLLFASMTAYLVAQLFDVHLYHFWWKVTKGRHMWIRNNGSTMVSQLVDTIIVLGIYLGGALKMSFSAVVPIIIAVYLCKVFLALVDTPLIYLGRSLLRKFLGLSADDAPSEAPLA